MHATILTFESVIKHVILRAVLTVEDVFSLSVCLFISPMAFLYLS